MKYTTKSSIEIARTHLLCTHLCVYPLLFFSLRYVIDVSDGVASVCLRETSSSTHTPQHPPLAAGGLGLGPGGMLSDSLLSSSMSMMMIGDDGMSSMVS